MTVDDVTYVDGFQPIPEAVPSIDTYFEWVSKPEVIMTVGHKGRTTPMACGVMVARDVARKACSRLF